MLLVVSGCDLLYALFLGRVVTGIFSNLRRRNCTMSSFYIQSLAEATAYDVRGEKVGKIEDIYVNDATGQPDFVSVNTGVLGLSKDLVPLRGHTFDGEDVTLAFEKDRIQDAPVTDRDGHLTERERDELYRYYGLESAEDTVTYVFDTEQPVEVDADTPARDGVEVVPVDKDTDDEVDRVALDAPELLGEVGSVKKESDEVVVPASLGVFDGAKEPAGEKDVDGDEVIVNDPQGGLIASSYTPDADAGVSRGEARDELVLSEEQLRVEKERVESGEARIQKVVVTEMKTIEVPVTREELRVVREPISEEDRVKYEGVSLGDQEASIVLHEERVVVSKVTVPVERVSLRTELVEDTKVVEESVARERLETSGGKVEDSVGGFVPSRGESGVRLESFGA